MKYWWVNHKQTFKHELRGNYIWSPKRKKNGHFNKTYWNLTVARINDIVFSYADTLIKAVGIVKENYRDSNVPQEFGNTGNLWDKDGYLVEVQWIELDIPVKPKDHFGALKKLFPEKHSPILKNGNGSQSVYLAEIEEALSNKLLELIGLTNPRIENSINKIRSFNIDKTEKQNKLMPDDADDTKNNDDGYSSSGQDERDITIREIKARRGQKKFRNDLRKRFANKCAITECEILDILEAAHINPYRGKNDNHPDNGLLLRSDIHTLFDLNLIGIEPYTYKVHLQERIKSEYLDIHLKKILIIDSKVPDEKALENRWKDFSAKNH